MSSDEWESRVRAIHDRLTWIYFAGREGESINGEVKILTDELNELRDDLNQLNEGDTE